MAVSGDRQRNGFPVAFFGILRAFFSAAVAIRHAPGWTNGKVSGLKSRALERALRVRLPPRVTRRPGLGPAPVQARAEDASGRGPGGVATEVRSGPATRAHGRAGRTNRCDLDRARRILISPQQPPRTGDHHEEPPRQDPPRHRHRRCSCAPMAAQAKQGADDPPATSATPSTTPPRRRPAPTSSVSASATAAITAATTPVAPTTASPGTTRAAAPTTARTTAKPQSFPHAPGDAARPAKDGGRAFRLPPSAFASARPGFRRR